MPDSATFLRQSGPAGSKKTIAVLGDGFAEADQNAYNAAVDSYLIKGVFGEGFFREDASAFNIVRINLVSRDSGVSRRVYDEKGTPTDASDDVIVSETFKDTALGYIFSGSWAHCWLENGTDTQSLLEAGLDKWAPEHDLVVVILNEPGYGGCGGGNWQCTTLGSDWHVMAHEFGHSAGGLADEYCTSGRTWAGSEPASPNITTVTDRAKVKWRQFIAPLTPLPTGVGACVNYNQGQRPANWDSNQDAGLFEGASYCDHGVYRPVESCRMQSNWPQYCPVCYTEMKDRYNAYTGRSFLRVACGDFNGDRMGDVLVQGENMVEVYLGTGDELEFACQSTASIEGGWPIGPHDQFLAADLDGDGADEIVAFNGADWNIPRLGLMRLDPAHGLVLYARHDGKLPGWTMRPGDRLVRMGGEQDDVLVCNSRDWAKPYLAVLHAGRTGVETVARHNGTLPGWQMRPNDRLAVGDFDGDGRTDLCMFNGRDWAIPYLGLFRSTDKGFTKIARYDNALAGWTMRPHDQYIAADFDGDGRTDLFVHNAQDWAAPYLGMLKSTGTGLVTARRYQQSMPGWTFRRGDRLQAGDFAGNGHISLVVYNGNDWAVPYLGTMVSDGTALTCSRVAARLGDWTFTSQDRFETCSRGGVNSPTRLVAHNRDWLGLLKVGPAPACERAYLRWIHNYRYGRNT